MEKIIELEQWEQDIILACKNWYEREGENALECLQRVVESINGCEAETNRIETINHWLYEVYDKIKEIKECEIGEFGLRDFILGKSIYQRYEIYKEYGATFWFLRNSIANCKCNDDDFELILNVNEELK